jgi:nitroreductase
LELVLDYVYDAKRYFRHYMPHGQPRTETQLMFRLLQRAHSIEKALSLPDVKVGFGIPKMRELLGLIAQYRNKNLPLDKPEINMAMEACKSYVDFHLANGVGIMQDIPEFDPAIHLPAPSKIPSTIIKTAAEQIEAARGDYAALAMSRSSIRQFAEAPVDPRLIREAVLIAQKCPSVCNRQSAHAWLIQKPELVREVLGIQRGANGFAHQVGTVLVLSASLESFDTSRERNQAFIDGGLFAMSLMHALHYKGLGVCALNWSTNRHKDRLLRNAIPIPDSHIIIMLLAVGHYRETFSVATSPRRDTNDVLRELDTN